MQISGFLGQSTKEMTISISSYRIGTLASVIFLPEGNFMSFYVFFRNFFKLFGIIVY